MQFQKKTSLGKNSNIIRILIKLMFLLFIIFLSFVLIDKINFPYPNKKIEKIVPNDNFKVVK